MDDAKWQSLPTSPRWVDYACATFLALFVAMGVLMTVLVEYSKVTQESEVSQCSLIPPD